PVVCSPKKTTPKPRAEDWMDRIAKIADLTETFAKAEMKSAYQLDGLLGALTETAAEARMGRNSPQAKPTGKK
ncbi:MAG: hypothetical protein LBP74_05795, partial [Treponema sp.]|nr:hypothetical protein [Treponema sp.]